jgi:hypothetical protein
MRLSYFILAAIASLAIAAPVKLPPCPKNYESDPNISAKIRSFAPPVDKEKKCQSS